MTDLRLARAMSEDQLQENIRDLCRLLGLPVMHVHDSRRCWLRGWPDLVIIGRSKIIYRELKAESGSVSPEQRLVGYQLQAAGADWKVWRPRHWLDGQVRDELRLLGGQPELPLGA